MRVVFALLLLSPIVLSGIRAVPQQTGMPIPPGVRKADQLPGPADVPPMQQPTGGRPAADVLRDQARELADLAQDIPAQIGSLNEGKLPKGLSENLKRIEKLSKTLRSEINR
jgi:hypothetical protein